MPAASSRGRRRSAPQERETRDEARARRAAIVDPETVLAAAARLLESRPRAVAEVRRHLAFAGYRADLVEDVIARLVRIGYLDDEAFALAWIASRDRAHPRGERALRMELARKGVDREIVDAVLDGRATPDTGDGTDAGASATVDELTALHLLESRRAALERAQDPRRRRERAYALLARSGFDPDTAARAIRRFSEPYAGVDSTDDV